MSDAKVQERKLLEPACSREKVAIIFNPVSGTQDPTTRRSGLEALAKDVGLTCSLQETDRDKGATPLAEKAVKDGMERVLVSGGDGSVTEAANVLAGTGVGLAVLPGGTGNLLALNLQLPNDPEKAMRLAMMGEARPLDIGRANGTVFLIMVGIGYDGRVIQDANRELKQQLGVLAYFVAAVRHIRRRFVHYTITIDGQRFRRWAKTVIVANVGCITGGLELVPGADPHDGKLEVAILRARYLRQFAALAAQVLFGRRANSRLLEIHRGERILIETRLPQPVEVDGNEAPDTTRLEVHIEPGALRLVSAPPQTEADKAAASGGAPEIPLWIPVMAGAVAASALYWRQQAGGGRGKKARLRVLRIIGTGLAASALASAIGGRRRLQLAVVGTGPFANT